MINVKFAPAVYRENRDYRRDLLIMKEVLGLPCYASLRDIPGAMDHVILSIPPESVLKRLDDCAEKRVNAPLLC